MVYIFLFQAEDGIRDIGVTGVQTCALPISVATYLSGHRVPGVRLSDREVEVHLVARWVPSLPELAERVRAALAPTAGGRAISRSKERRVGKECRSRWSPYH